MCSGLVVFPEKKPPGRRVKKLLAGGSASCKRGIYREVSLGFHFLESAFV